MDGLADATRLFNGAEIEEAVKESMFMAYVDNPTNPIVNVHHLETACTQIIPLAKTMSEKIRGLRAWADDRARRASIIANQELLPENQVDIKKRNAKKMKILSDNSHSTSEIKQRLMYTDAYFSGKQ